MKLLRTCTQSILTNGRSTQSEHDDEVVLGSSAVPLFVPISSGGLFFISAVDTNARRTESSRTPCVAHMMKWNGMGWGVQLYSPYSSCYTPSYDIEVESWRIIVCLPNYRRKIYVSSLPFSLCFLVVVGGVARYHVHPYPPISHPSGINPILCSK